MGVLPGSYRIHQFRARSVAPGWRAADAPIATNGQRHGGMGTASQGNASRPLRVPPGSEAPVPGGWFSAPGSIQRMAAKDLVAMILIVGFG